MSSTGEKVKPAKKRAPTLYIIIALKLGKGLLLLLLAAGVYSLHDNNLPEDFAPRSNFSIWTRKKRSLPNWPTSWPR